MLDEATRGILHGPLFSLRDFGMFSDNIERLWRRLWRYSECNLTTARESPYLCSRRYLRTAAVRSFSAEGVNMHTFVSYPLSFHSASVGM